MLSRLPDSETVFTSVTKLKSSGLNPEKLGTLINNWPGDEMEDLLAEAMVDGKIPDDLSNWEKPEAFFIRLGKERKFDTRLRLWKFLIDFEPKVKLLDSQLKQLIDSFTLIKDNKNIHKILSKILTIGNMMNAGDLKRG